MLAKRTSNYDYQIKADQMLASFSETLKQRPSIAPYLLLSVSELVTGYIDVQQYAAKGAVFVNTTVHQPKQEKQSSISVSAKIYIQKGWHINSNKPLQDNLIATVLTLAKGESNWEITKLIYPKQEMLALGFQKAPLALYQGNLEINMLVKKNKNYKITGSTILPLTLKIQACNDKVCLAPEELILRVPVID